MSGVEPAADAPVAGAGSERDDDIVQPFRVEAAGIRGRYVRLGASIDDVLGGHDYPDSVSELLGELTAVAVAMAGAFKFQGAMSLQAASDGAVPLMIAGYTAPAGDGAPAHIRGYARFDAGRVAATEGAGLLGAGHLVFNVETGPQAERYQGIVPLVGGSVAASIHEYFRQSDQLDAAMRVDAGRGGDGAWRAGGILIQRMPPPGGMLVEDNEWDRARAVVDSARRSELLDLRLAPVGMLRRLFPGDDLRVWRPVPVEARCRCSTERVHRMLHSFPPEELEGMADDGVVTVTCEFCGTVYAIPALDGGEVSD